MKQPKKVNRILDSLLTKIVYAINIIIDHKLFKPIATSIIVCFFVFQGIGILSTLFEKFEEDVDSKIFKPIKVIIKDPKIKNSLITKEQTHQYRVKSGDNLIKIMLDIGAKEREIFNILAALKKLFNPKDILVGDLIKIKYKIQLSSNNKNDQIAIDQENFIESLEIFKNPEEKIIVRHDQNGAFIASKEKIKLNKYLLKYHVNIKNGLFSDGAEAGISPNIMMNMINLYSYDVDFQRDIREGDQFEIIIESFYSEEGEKVKDGNILFASLDTRGRPIDLYMFEYRSSNEYFSPKGESARKSLLKTPVNGARISSKFGMRRHPILGYSKMHKGVDFAAPTGTPILAAGDGIITYRDRKGAYGNYVRIRHNANYSTAYAHASRFNPKFKKGSRVKQGDVIAYIGTTGRSTGPHLHFEVLKNDKQINPSKLKVSSGISLKNKDLARFNENKKLIDQYRIQIPNQVNR